MFTNWIIVAKNNDMPFFLVKNDVLSRGHPNATDASVRQSRETRVISRIWSFFYDHNQRAHAFNDLYITPRKELRGYRLPGRFSFSYSLSFWRKCWSLRVAELLKRFFYWVIVNLTEMIAAC